MNWINVNDELPCVDRKDLGHGLCNVLVTHVYNYMTIVDQAFYLGEGKFYNSFGPLKDVRYWMYMPDPPDGI